MDWITELKRQVERLEAENERLRENIRVRDEADALTIERHATENERLRAALKEAGEIIDYLADYASGHGLGYMPADRWLALNGGKQHGHVQSGEDEFGKTGRNEPEKP